MVEAPVSLTYDVIGQNSATSGLLATAYAPFSSSSVGYTGTVAQTKIITGVDANGSASDGSITWNFAYPWATGDRVGNRQYDFQAVALHEMLHTLGFLTGIESPTSMDRNWTIYDSFLATSDGTAAIGGDYVWNSAYTTNLTGATEDCTSTAPMPWRPTVAWFRSTRRVPGRAEARWRISIRITRRSGPTSWIPQTASAPEHG